MPIVSVLHDYLVWHYSVAYADIVGICRNYCWAVNHVFSVQDLLRTLFAPFKRLKEEQVNVVLDPGGFATNLVVNIIMRIVGFIIRMLLLVSAFFALLLVIVLGVVSALLWTILPAIVVYCFISGLNYLFL